LNRAVRVPAETLREVTASLSAGDRDEMAVPSYSHANPLIRWLFWKRLDTAIALADLKPSERIFEFGVGSGVLLPTYHSIAARVAATDLHLEPAREMARRRGFPTEFVTVTNFPAWSAAQAGSFDAIFALDVLEHVEGDELIEVSGLFRRLLAPGGRLIVSGPTESLAYKLGRFVAGFHGEYHHRNIFDIDRELRAKWKTERALFVPRLPLPRAFLLTRYAPL
jgi:2-polyprenyl-3-methyl-5-hydroxy-6-metoxy-1,4-benzoquinol methylase